MRSGRVIGLGQFAQGMARRSSHPESRVTSWVLVAAPVVMVVIWVVARVTRHL